MIDNIRIYYQPKIEYQKWLLKTDLFKNQVCKYNYSTNLIDYPISASIEGNGIKIHIDKYKAFISIYVKAFHNSTEYRGKLSSIRNISFSQLNNILQKTESFLVNVNRAKISQIQLSFAIPLEIPGKSIIEENILMLNYKYYNHDRIKQKQKIIKKFELTNFNMTFMAEKKGVKSNYLNVVLKMKKSLEFKELQFIYHLLEKEKLKEIFSVFLKRYDQLIIVDSIESFERFNGVDKSLMKKFMFYGYWTNTSEKISRQALCKQKKKFESLLSKYDLLKNKTTIKRKLEIAFEEFISN
jgi:hypothetical protein